MNIDQSTSHLLDRNSIHNTSGDDVKNREMVFENSALALSSQAVDAEFVHETADYQWLLDYDMAISRYRECYARDCLGSSVDGTTRTSVLQQGKNDTDELSYEALSRDIDASLAHIDMDDFRSEDIHQLLVMPDVCDQIENEEDDLYDDFSESLSCSLSSSGFLLKKSCEGQMMHLRNLKKRRKAQLKSSQASNPEDDESEISNRDEDSEGNMNGTSGDGSLYRSGPLFSPFREPQQVPISFSVDSLDSGSMHDDLILTCQANKNNYTIAFEGSFIQYSGESDYHENGGSDTTDSASWTNGKLESRSPAPSMTHSDQSYTTWSRVCKEPTRSLAPDHKNTTQNSPFKNQSRLHPATERSGRKLNKHLGDSLQHDEVDDTKSNSLPNLMKRSLMKKSSDVPGQCVKVFDLQQSYRSNQLCNTRSVDGSNFSLMRLFIKQKSLSKDAVSVSSSFTDPSQGVCSSSENQSCGNDSSDWPMNSQSENDMDRSASPVPLSATNNHIIHGRTFNQREPPPTILPIQSMNTSDTNEFTGEELTQKENLLSNDNTNNNYSSNNTTKDTITNLDISLKDASPCSKRPVTSPIKEEPEGMDISMDNQLGKNRTIENSHDKSLGSQSDNNAVTIDSRTTFKNVCNNNIDDEHFMHRNNAEILGTRSLRNLQKNEKSTFSTQHKANDSSDSTSGYISSKDASGKIRSTIEAESLETLSDRPKPKPRLLKNLIDQSLQTSNLKVSSAVNTSSLENTKEVYIYYPNYALPNLDFLKQKRYNVDTRVFLVPQHYRQRGNDAQERIKALSKRPFSCGDLDKIRKLGFSHIKDWNSLNFLLPKELKELLFDNTDCMETLQPSFCNSSQNPTLNDCLLKGVKDYNTTLSSSNCTQPSSGYKGSSTLLNNLEEDVKSNEKLHHLKSSPSTEGNLRITETDFNIRKSLAPSKGILLKERNIPSKRYSSNIPMEEVNKIASKRHSLQEPVQSDFQSNNNRKIETQRQDIMSCSCTAQCTGFCSRGLRHKNLLLLEELPCISTHETLSETDYLKLRSEVSEFLAKRGSLDSNEFKANDVTNLSSSNDSTKKCVSFEKTNSSTRKVLSESQVFCGKERKSTYPVNFDEDFPPMLYDSHDKKTLVLSVRSAVEKLVKHFNKGRSQQEKNKLGTSSTTPEVAQLAIDKLCPAIYALLSDGLLPTLHSLFGKISNSVWRVVEATSQIGPSTKALNDLVLTLNSEDSLSEGPVKFNAFIFGLLNIRSIDAWLSYLRTRESALQKHYHPEAFLYLSNTAMKGLYDDLLLALRPLALLPFRLDLLHEYKILHASMMKMEERLALHSSCNTTEKSMNLIAGKESKDFRNVAARSNRRDRSPRPRSCHESSFGCNNTQNNYQMGLKKRWSGIQMGSKLATALDKLMAEENAGQSSEDYSDSLDTPGRNMSFRDKNISSGEYATDMKISEISSRDGDISECSATYKDTDTEKELLKKNLTIENASEGHKFRKLQLKWEAMTGYSIQSNERDKNPGNEREKCSVTSPAGAQKSKIPRPVSIFSPSQTFKPFEPSKERTSPLVRTNKKAFTPPTEKQFRQAPRKSLKDRIIPTDHHHDALVPSNKSKPGARTPGSTNTTFLSSGNRASSVPGRNIDRGSMVNKQEIPKREVVHRSSSHGRKDIFGIQNKLVQTLHHRLATDNGHLSFNRGDVLTVVVEVDDRFLLCCSRDRKGLVPRASVVMYHQ